MIERCYGLRLPLDPTESVASDAFEGEITLMATSRLSRGSRARYTSPMPPAPMKATISYGPSVVPGDSRDGRLSALFPSIPELLTRRKHNPLSSKGEPTMVHAAAHATIKLRARLLLVS